jgi:hypothetical protein
VGRGLMCSGGNYYSFPSFEDFQEYQVSEEERRREGRGENGVP